jgi:anti-anti-sigma regulatory factor
LTVIAESIRDTTVLHAHGVLEDTTYIALRDRIIDAALAQPRAVVVDVTELQAPTESAWSALSSARWIVGRWPQVPIVLVCEQEAGRDALVRTGIASHVPVYPTVDSALEALPVADPHEDRRRARAELPATPDSLRQARELVAEWLTAWSQTDLIPVTKVVVTAFIENVLQHTDCHPELRLETDGATVTVAVEDSSHSPAIVREGEWATDAPSGLLIVSALCRTWGNAPMSGGKTVWAVIGPENRL